VVAEICRHLDGLPLAIELAAARVKLLPPQALLARLTPRLNVLSSGARDVPARQQTLRNTIAWSHQLLDAEEQQLFRRLSVFVGGCRLSALEAVAAALDGEVGRVFEGVASLLDQSLLLQSEQEGEEPRLQMLETIREYGLELLEASGEKEKTQRVHAAYYLALAEEAEPELAGPRQAMWLERLEQEHDNLRAALSWSLEQGVDEEAAYRREVAMRLGGALRQFWISHAHLAEGRTFLERAIAASRGAAPTLRAKVLIAAADIALVQGNRQRGEALAEEGLLLCREVGDRVGIAFCLYQLGFFATTKGQYAQARTLLEESATLYRALGNRELGWTLYALGRLDVMQGEYGKARAHYEEALGRAREVGIMEYIADSLSLIAWVEARQRNYTAVRSLYGEILTLA
jgi:tetratricopeptide (TPR) repeat protein